MEIDWFQWFYVDDLTNTLFWKVNRESANGIIKAFADTPAGGIDADGYVTVKLHGKKYKAHRIIWEMMNLTKIPKGFQIDHINGVRNDNTLSNLRLVSHTENARNQRLRVTNKTGVMGVQKITRGNHTFYQARWSTLEGKEKSKAFSCDKYEDAFTEACKCREAAIKHLNECGAGYHDNHGNK